MTPVQLKYHTVAPERIVAATLRDLAASGIPERALGRVSASRRATLVACTVLNDHARSYLPASLGGTADGLDASDDTLSLADASFARSPVGRAMGGAAAPTTPTRAQPSPPRSLFGAAPRLSPSSPTRLALERASQAALATAAAAASAARAAAAATEEAIAARDAAAVVLHGVERRHTRAHPRGALEGGLDLAAGRAPRRGLGAEADDVEAAEAPEQGDDGAGGDDGDDASLPPPDGSRCGSRGGSDDADGPAPEQQATYEDLARATAEYEALAAAATEARLNSASAQGRADAAQAEADASVSLLSSTSAGGVIGGAQRPTHDVAREQESLTASITSEGLKADGIAGLLAHRKKFPLIAQAMLRRSAGEDHRAAALSDLPVLALLPAYQASRLQEHGLEILATSAGKAATDRPGARARAAFASGTFDLLASQAIEEGAVDVAVAPLDLCAGVLPVAQLGLHLWLKHYTYVESDSTALVTLAQGVSFVKDRVLDPHAGLATFLPAWGVALGEEDAIPATDVYFALLSALLRDKDAVGASSVYVIIDGVSLNWTAFAHQSGSAWRSAGGARRCTRLQLIKFVRILQAFGEARLDGLGDPLPPPSREGSARAFVATTASVIAPPAPPIPARRTGAPPTGSPAPPTGAATPVASAPALRLET